MELASPLANCTVPISYQSAHQGRRRREVAVQGLDAIAVVADVERVAAARERGRSLDVDGVVPELAGGLRQVHERGRVARDVDGLALRGGQHRLALGRAAGRIELVAVGRDAAAALTLALSALSQRERGEGGGDPPQRVVDIGRHRPHAGGAGIGGRIGLRDLLAHRVIAEGRQAAVAVRLRAHKPGWCVRCAGDLLDEADFRGRAQVGEAQRGTQVSGGQRHGARGGPAAAQGRRRTAGRRRPLRAAVEVVGHRVAAVKRGLLDVERVGPGLARRLRQVVERGGLPKRRARSALARWKSAVRRCCSRRS